MSWYLNFLHFIEFLENVTMHRNVMKFPSDEDLNGAVAALIRLQDTYNLDTASIARGELNGVKYRWVCATKLYYTKSTSSSCVNWNILAHIHSFNGNTISYGWNTKWGKHFFVFLNIRRRNDRTKSTFTNKWWKQIAERVKTIWAWMTPSIFFLIIQFAVVGGCAHNASSTIIYRLILN